MTGAALDYPTQSLCPLCLRTVEGRIFSGDEGVYLEKTCPEHGAMTLKIWPDAEHYQWMKAFHLPHVRPGMTKTAESDCPTSCGLCTRHLRKPTLVEIEVTKRCNLRCPVCFMNADDAPPDPDLPKLGSMYASILEEMGPQVSIQLTGGEPTVRKDLAHVVRLGTDMGFSAIEINTNGLAIAHDPCLLPALKEAGATGIYLQFDGIDSGVYRQIRGNDLLAKKLLVLERCREAGVQVVLAMTVIKDINGDQIGRVLDFALENFDVVAGLALQPAFTSGRFEVDRPDPLTMGDVIFMLADQSHGLIGPYDLWPLGCSHPLCSTGTYLALRDGNDFCPVTRLISPEEYMKEFNPDSPQGSVFADLLADRKEYTGKGLSIVIMNYMDAWNMDLQRLQECSMTVKAPEGGTVPFCAYHLTNSRGERMYKG